MLFESNVLERCENSLLNYRINNQKLCDLMREITKEMNWPTVLQVVTHKRIMFRRAPMLNPLLFRCTLSTKLYGMKCCSRHKNYYSIILFKALIIAWLVMFVQADLRYLCCKRFTHLIIDFF